MKTGILNPLLRRFRLFALLCLLAALFGCSAFHEKKDVLYQVSTIHALLEGAYEGVISFEELGRYGDTGIGTFDGLDGEMIGLEGRFYQIREDGRAYPVRDSMKTPFAVVTFFEPHHKLLLEDPVDCGRLQRYISDSMPTQHTIYVLKIEGTFRHVKTRSVPKQNKPYPRLVEVVKNQPTFEFSDVTGTIIGVWLPEYLKGINVPGYHFHFITADKTAGGHLLACETGSVKIEVDQAHRLFLVLPGPEGLTGVDLAKERDGEVEKVER